MFDLEFLAQVGEHVVLVYRAHARCLNNAHWYRKSRKLDRTKIVRFHAFYPFLMKKIVRISACRLQKYCDELHTSLYQHTNRACTYGK